jgi:thioredoxin 1
MVIADIFDNNFEDKVLNSQLPVLVDFWAPWCGPCRIAAPVLEELSDTYKDKILFLKINVDENQGSAAKYDVMSIPTTILFKNQKEVGRQIGFAGKQAFEDLVKKAL